MSVNKNNKNLINLVNKIYAFCEKEGNEDFSHIDIITMRMTYEMLQGQNNLVLGICKHIISKLTDEDSNYQFDIEDWGCTLRDVWVDNDKVMGLADVDCVGDVEFEIVPTIMFWAKLKESFDYFKS